MSSIAGSTSWVSNPVNIIITAVGVGITQVMAPYFDGLPLGTGAIFGQAVAHSGVHISRLLIGRCVRSVQDCCMKQNLKNNKLMSSIPNCMSTSSILSSNACKSLPSSSDSTTALATSTDPNATALETSNLTRLPPNICFVLGEFMDQHNVRNAHSSCRALRNKIPYLYLDFSQKGVNVIYQTRGLCFTNDQLIAVLNQKSVTPLSIDLSGCALRINDLGIQEIVKKCPKLRFLNLRGCRQITDDSIRTLSENGTTRCPDLTQLNVSDCPKIRSRTVRMFAEERKINGSNLTIEKVSICDSFGFREYSPR